jgi:DNA mismatch repair protein MutH
MERKYALRSLQSLIGEDLRLLADRYRITVWTPYTAPGTLPPPDARLNKGWAGHVIERHLGLPLNSSRAPNFGSWELKLVPLKRKANGTLCVKETMAITMIDPVEVAAKRFEESHIFNKLRKTVIASRVCENRAETRSLLHSVGTFDLDDPAVFLQVKADYDLIRETIRTQGFGALSGTMGTLVQPRTKGPGHGSTSRAFYARQHFVSHILGLNPLQ